MIMPIRLWKLPGGIRPWIGRRWSIVIKTERWGTFDKDWFTDAVKVIDCGFFVLFDHGPRK